MWRSYKIYLHWSYHQCQVRAHYKSCALLLDVKTETKEKIEQKWPQTKIKASTRKRKQKQKQHCKKVWVQTIFWADSFWMWPCSCLPHLSTLQKEGNTKWHFTEQGKCQPKSSRILPLPERKRVNSFVLDKRLWIKTKDSVQSVCSARRKKQINSQDVFPKFSIFNQF